MENISYRKEIDGLRAIAVLPVMLFHAGASIFLGGFLGVDVFFVISGYLITNMILFQRSQNTFTFLVFYQRRIRRIIPALLLVMLFSIPLAYFFMHPGELENFGQSLVSTTFMANNILLYLTSGYWDLASDFKPLLHTWSLGVEEQYYIIFPLLIAALSKFSAIRLNHALYFLTLISFLFFMYMQNIDRDAAFYLLASRFWEIGIGACTAIFLIQDQRHHLSLLHRDFYLFLGLLCILLPMLVFNIFQLMPGLANLLVCLGTAIIIAFANPTSILGRILRARFLVLVGLMSYSLYLWHQPLLAFLRIISLEQPNSFSLILCFFLTFPIAFLSWKFENFLRYTASSKFFVSFVAIGILISLIAGALFVKTSGFYQYYPELQSTYSSSEFLESNNPHQKFLISASSNLQNGFTAPHLKNLVIMGDSFSSDLINMIKVNNFLEDFEIVKPKYNCVNFDDVNSDAFDLISQSDLILITYRVLRNSSQKECLTQKIQLLLDLDKKFIVIGPKDFGYNLNAPLKKKLYKFSAQPIEEIITFNSYLKNLIPAENFIDFLSVLGGSNAERRIPLFTNNQKLISYDKAHLTYDGAVTFGHILFSDTKFLNYIRSSY